MTGRTDRLWLALRVRELPLTALDIEPPAAEPAAVAEGQKVIFANSAARDSGVEIGMDLTTAQLLSGCCSFVRNPAREKQALLRLRDELYRFTPHIEIHQSREIAQAGLLLEISTCLKLFAGVKNLCARICAFLDAAGWDIRPGLAHSAPGAWLLSFARHDISGRETCQCFIERLNGLPVQVLYDYPKAVDTLLKTGFTTLGDIARQIQSSTVDSFTRRMGREFAGAIREIYGIDREFHQASLFSRPVTTYIPEEAFCDNIQFDYPVFTVDHLKPAFETLLQRLDDFLHRHQLACQHIQWRLSDIHQRSEVVDIHSDIPQNSWQLLYDLTLIRFDNRPTPFEVDCLELSYRDRISRQDTSLTLDFAGGRRQRGSSQELAVTLAKLKARVGDSGVHKVSYRDSPVPELSHAIVGVAERCVQALPDIHRNGLRPSWLLSDPDPIETRGPRLYWRGYLYLAAGPERIAGHWWQESVARDYYLARRQDNVALWVYFDLHSKGWYVHGIFS